MKVFILCSLKCFVTDGNLRSTWHGLHISLNSVEVGGQLSLLFRLLVITSRSSRLKPYEISSTGIPLSFSSQSIIANLTLLAVACLLSASKRLENLAPNSLSILRKTRKTTFDGVYCDSLVVELVEEVTKAKFASVFISCIFSPLRSLFFNPVS